jgi:hypothetical protein
MSYLCGYTAGGVALTMNSEPGPQYNFEVNADDVYDFPRNLI